MANTIQLRNSVVKDKTPLPSELVIGEVCVGANADSPMLLFKDNADNIIKIEPGSGVEPSPTPPASPSPGDLWFDTGNNTLNYWNGSDWEVITGDTDSLWKEDAGAVTPKATGADLAIEGDATIAGIVNVDGGTLAVSNNGEKQLTIGYSSGNTYNYINSYDTLSAAVWPLEIRGYDLCFLTGTTGQPVERMKIDSLGDATFAGKVTATTFDLEALPALPS